MWWYSCPRSLASVYCKSCDRVFSTHCVLFSYTLSVSCGETCGFMRSFFFQSCFGYCYRLFRHNYLWNCVAQRTIVTLLFPSTSSLLPPLSWSLLCPFSSLLPPSIFSFSTSLHHPPLPLCVLGRIWLLVQVQFRDQMVSQGKRSLRWNSYYLVSGCMCVSVCVLCVWSTLKITQFLKGLVEDDTLY